MFNRQVPFIEQINESGNDSIWSFGSRECGLIISGNAEGSILPVVIHNLMNTTVSLLSALIILASCVTSTQSPAAEVIKDEIEPDTIKPVITTSFKGIAYPAFFEAAFIPGTKASEDKSVFSFYNYDIGKIKIESGKIIACDPIVMHNAIPFTQGFPKGEFLVQLAMAKVNDYERVALSRIVFSEKPVSKWEFALKKGQKPISLKDSSFYCYGVDGGMGIFIDSVSNVTFNQMDPGEWKKTFIKMAEENGERGHMRNFDEHNLAVFTTGYGDGCYATYIGYDKEGNVCRLLTDFGIIEWWTL